MNYSCSLAGPLVGPPFSLTTGPRSTIFLPTAHRPSPTPSVIPTSFLQGAARRLAIAAVLCASRPSLALSCADCLEPRVALTASRPGSTSHFPLSISLLDRAQLTLFPCHARDAGAAIPPRSSSALDCRRLGLVPDRAPTTHSTAHLRVTPPQCPAPAATPAVVLVELRHEPVYTTSSRSSPSDVGAHLLGYSRTTTAAASPLR
jgi:hypothetical protein